ncbi:hypothetical protein AVEN_248679-1 [Araneus ventricosus]|uniref:Uncharacterized protein n=1 Tax=Araneus ventricosus TaxID=182803 RepID=A0A4Y2C084_ARAVE|nr:hypothetical protein AVEN_248679-1 [Araneus ventricosus]
MPEAFRGPLQRGPRVPYSARENFSDWGFTVQFTSGTLGFYEPEAAKPRGINIGTIRSRQVPEDELCGRGLGVHYSLQLFAGNIKDVTNQQPGLTLHTRNDVKVMSYCNTIQLLLITLGNLWVFEARKENKRERKRDAQNEQHKTIMTTHSQRKTLSAAAAAASDRMEKNKIEKGKPPLPQPPTFTTPAS